MLAIKHILFPLDFSDRCSAAAPYVEAMANRFGAKVTLISVAQPFDPSGLGDPGLLVTADTGALIAELKKRLDGALVKEFSGLNALQNNVERFADLGDPADVITSFAHQHAVDLIMMSTHGYGTFRTLLLGSVAAKVLHDAKCPVWTAAHGADLPSPDHVKPSVILCATDSTSRSLPLLKWAAEYSKGLSAELRLIHVVPGMDSFPASQMNQEFELDMKKEARDQIAKMQQSAGIEAHLAVESGNIAELVREEALRHGAGLVVVGRGVLKETLGRLRSNAYSIIRHAPCPVLSI
jgi:nucleotide-binding universal stress UspA family protein